MIAELLAKIGVDTSDLNKAEVHLKDFEGKVQKAFGRPPPGERRAESAATDLVKSLSGGDVSGAIEGLTSRLSGVGLIGGTAISLITFALGKAGMAAKEAAKELEGIDQSLQRIPMVGQGVEGLGSQLNEAAGAMAQMKKSGFAEWWEGLGNRWNVIPQQLANIFNTTKNLRETLKENRELETRPEETKAAERADQVARMVDLLGKQATAARENADMAVKSAMGDAEGAAQLKTQMEYEQGLARLSGERDVYFKSLQEGALGLTAVERFALGVAEMRNVEARKYLLLQEDIAKSTRDKYAAESSKEEVTAQAEVNMVKAQGLNTTIEQNQLALLNIAHLERQLQMARGLDAVEKERLRNQLLGAEAEQVARQERSKKEEMDKGKMTLQELIQLPERGITGYSTYLARQVQHEMQLQESYRERGLPEEALKHQMRADALKERIPLLKESEKDPAYAFLNALDSARVLSDMRNFLEDIADGVKDAGGTNPFLNR